MFVGDLDTVVAHALGLGVQPDGSLIFGADGGERRFVGSLKGDTGVVGAAPRGRGALNLLNLTRWGDIADSITEVARGRAAVRGNDDISGVVSSLLGEYEVTVDIRRGKSIAREARATEESSERLLPVGVLVHNGERVLGFSRDDLVGKEGETVVVSNETTGFLTILDHDGSTDGRKGLGVDALDVYASTTGIEVGEESGLAIWRDGKGSSTMVGKTRPVSLLNGIKGASQSKSVDVLLERRGSELSSSQSQSGGKGEKTRHRDVKSF
jgi:hypothetical protein